MDNIRVVCEADPETWVEYRANISRKDINAYAAAIANNDLPALAEVLSGFITGMNVSGCGSVDELNAAEDVPLYAETFFALAFGEAIATARQLGKPRRLA